VRLSLVLGLSHFRHPQKAFCQLSTGYQQFRKCFVEVPAADDNRIPVCFHSGKDSRFAKQFSDKRRTGTGGACDQLLPFSDLRTF
jgi:hypothetical protein